MYFRKFSPARAAVILMLLASTLPAARLQPLAGKKAIAFSGRVESVDLKHWTVAVTHGNIPGFMPAMTMDYPVEDPGILRRLTPADRITAIVFVGDPTLHEVRIAGHDSR